MIVTPSTLSSRPLYASIRPNKTGRIEDTVNTSAVFFPFDLFGSAGARTGAELLADAFRELLADNRRERMPTRALAYQPHVRQRELSFDTIAEYESWRSRGRQAVRHAWRKGDFLLW